MGVSDTDSFINEVTEEVQKDKLWGYVRKYGWIAVLAIIGIVGGAAWNEVNKARNLAVAQSTGDALIAGLNETDPTARAALLSTVNAEGAANAVTALLTAGAQQDAGDGAAAAQTLEALVVNQDIPKIYRDLAAFKAAMIDTGDNATRRQSLEALSVPGAPFALLAQEQLAFMDVAVGDTVAAVAKLNAIAEDAAVTDGLRQRVLTLLVALGEDIAPAGAEAAAE
jgi:hypothetical protein